MPARNIELSKANGSHVTTEEIDDRLRTDGVGIPLCTLLEVSAGVPQSGLTVFCWPYVYETGVTDNPPQAKFYGVQVKVTSETGFPQDAVINIAVYQDDLKQLGRDWPVG